MGCLLRFYIMKNWRLVLLLGALLSIALLWQLKTMIYDAGPLRTPTSIVIAKGDNSHIVADLLKENGIINNALLFRVFARFYQVDKKLKAGEYAFIPYESLFEVMQKIAHGDVIYRKITLPEGLTKREMLDIINNDDMLSGEITIEVEEGEMLPETYSYTRGMSKDSIVKRAKKAMKKVLKSVWQDRDETIPLKDKKQLLILASIVEKETSVDIERSLVASVFTNRLRKGMRLQTDPTVIYALTLGQYDLGRKLTKKDLSYDNPYNTYVYYGLPPTPICSPGVASIYAAAHPEVSDYLYFVASGKGGHNFSSSLKQHNDHVANYRKKRKKK